MKITKTHKTVTVVKLTDVYQLVELSRIELKTIMEVLGNSKKEDFNRERIMGEEPLSELDRVLMNIAGYKLYKKIADYCDEQNI